MLKFSSLTSSIGLAVLLAGCSNGGSPPASPVSDNGGVPVEQQQAQTAETSLDATASNPGTSVTPPDAGQTKKTDEFSYTLLDVRKDTVDAVYGGYPVYLVKLKVERIAGDGTIGLSVANVDLASGKSKTERGVDQALFFRNDIAYSRSNMGVDLGGDVKKLAIGQSVVGYYAFRADTPANATSVYFNVRNLGVVEPGKGVMSWADSFRVK